MAEEDWDHHLITNVAPDEMGSRILVLDSKATTRKHLTLGGKATDVPFLNGIRICRMREDIPKSR